MRRVVVTVFLSLLILFGEGGKPEAQTQQCVAAALAGGTGDAITIPKLPCAMSTNLLMLTTTSANTTESPTLTMQGFGPQRIGDPTGASLPVGALPGGNAVVLLMNTGSIWKLVSSGISSMNTSPGPVYATGITVGGTSNAITLSFANGPVGYSPSQVFVFQASSTNTDATTLKVNGLAPIGVQIGGASLRGGEIRAGQTVQLVYDGAHFQLMPGSLIIQGIYPSNAVCDGSTDVSTQINLDLANAPNGTTVFLPPSSLTKPCILNSSIVFPLNKQVNLEGSGTLIHYTGSSFAVEVADLAVGGYTPPIMVGGLNIVCTDTVNGGGIELRNSIGETLHDISVDSCSTHLLMHNTTVDGIPYYSENNSLIRLELNKSDICVFIDADNGTTSFANTQFLDVHCDSINKLGKGISMAHGASIYRSTFTGTSMFMTEDGATGIFPNGDWTGVSGNINFESFPTAHNTVAVDFTAPAFSTAGVQLFSHVAGVTGPSGNVCYQGTPPMLWTFIVNFEAGGGGPCAKPVTLTYDYQYGLALRSKENSGIAAPINAMLAPPVAPVQTTGNTIDTSGYGFFFLNYGTDTTLTGLDESLAASVCTQGHMITLFNDAAVTMTVQGSSKIVNAGGAGTVDFTQYHSVSYICRSDTWYQTASS